MEVQRTDNDLFRSLRPFTAARIGIGSAGAGVPVAYSLEFKLAHATARDAVHSAMDVDTLTKDLHNHGLTVLHLHSQAADRSQYLRRPDLGRKLDDTSLALIPGDEHSDIAIIIADGLSATALERNTAALLNELLPKLLAANFTLAPVCLVTQGRVAIGDQIASAMNAQLSLLLIGERPGLSAADSMGAYLTYAPRPGLTDEMRNCVSNIRPMGLDHKSAADKIFYLITQAFKLKLSGLELKDNAGLIGNADLPELNGQGTDDQ